MYGEVDRKAFRAAIIHALEAARDTGDELFDEACEEFFLQLADKVFSLDWDSRGPGAGAGQESVYRLGATYFTSSEGCGWDGPYCSLDEALGGSIAIGASTQEIRCSEWSEDEIISRVWLHDPPPVVTINGSEWPLETLEHRVEMLRKQSNPETSN